MSSLAYLEGAYAQLKGKSAIEILAFEIREAARCVWDFIREISPAEVLRKEFAEFCIGK